MIGRSCPNRVGRPFKAVVNFPKKAPKGGARCAGSGAQYAVRSDQVSRWRDRRHFPRTAHRFPRTASRNPTSPPASPDEARPRFEPGSSPVQSLANFVPQGARGRPRLAAVRSRSRRRPGTHVAGASRYRHAVSGARCAVIKYRDGAAAATSRALRTAARALALYQQPKTRTKKWAGGQIFVSRE